MICLPVLLQVVTLVVERDSLNLPSVSLNADTGSSVSNHSSSSTSSPQRVNSCLSSGASKSASRDIPKEYGFVTKGRQISEKTFKNTATRQVARLSDHPYQSSTSWSPLQRCWVIYDMTAVGGTHSKSQQVSSMSILCRQHCKLMKTFAKTACSKQKCSSATQPMK